MEIKKRKFRTLRLLPMENLQNRPCTVDGRPALFHRWIEEERVLLKVNAFTTPEDQQRLLYKFREMSLVAPECSTEVLHSVLALVEYRDGTVAKVKPERVRFVEEG